MTPEEALATVLETPPGARDLAVAGLRVRRGRVAPAPERALHLPLRVAVGDDAPLVGRSRPRASAISSFTRPSLKYILVGTSVRPRSRTFP